MHYAIRYRRSLLLTITLAGLTLSACGSPDAQSQAAVPTASATASGATASASADQPTPVLPLTDKAADQATTAVAAIEATSGTPTAVALPTTLQDSSPSTTTAIFEIASSDPFTGTDVLSETDELSGTAALEASHPVAQAIADHFGVTTDEIIAQHEEGLGFGEIARAYFLARELAADDDTSNDLSADAILAMHQAGAGWGQIIKTLGLPTGNRTRNLGQIMSGRARDKATDTTSAAPAQSDHPNKSKVDKPNTPHTNNGGNTTHSDNRGSGNNDKSGQSTKTKKSK